MTYDSYNYNEDNRLIDCPGCGYPIRAYEHECAQCRDNWDRYLELGTGQPAT